MWSIVTEAGLRRILVQYPGVRPARADAFRAGQQRLLRSRAFVRWNAVAAA